MNAQHRIAIVGLGTVGLRYVEQYQAHPCFELVGGYDVSAEACNRAADEFGVVIAESAEALIADPAVDVVYVAVPPVHHRYYVDLVIDADKALLCEKPLAVNDEESTSMVARVASTGARAAVNFVFGAAPSAIRLIDDIAESGDSVHSVDVHVHFEEWPRAWQAGAGWLRDRDQGGWTREVLSHYVFLLVRLLGPDLSIVHCAAHFPADGSSEQRLSAVLAAGDVSIHVTGTSDAAGRDEVVCTVRGHAQAWRLTNWYEYTKASRGGDWVPGLSADEQAPPAAYASQLSQLAALVEGRPQTLATFEESLVVQRVVESLLDQSDRPG